MALFRPLQASLPTLLQRWGAALHTSTSLRGLEELIVLPPKEDEKEPSTGALRLGSCIGRHCCRRRLPPLPAGLLCGTCPPDGLPVAAAVLQGAAGRRRTCGRRAGMTSTSSGAQLRRWAAAAPCQLACPSANVAWLLRECLAAALPIFWVCHLLHCYASRRFVLLKERTRLHAEKQLYRSRGERMPDPSRIGKVRKSMARIKHVRID